MPGCCPSGLTGRDAGVSPSEGDSRSRRDRTRAPGRGSRIDVARGRLRMKPTTTRPGGGRLQATGEWPLSNDDKRKRILRPKTLPSNLGRSLGARVRSGMLRPLGGQSSSLPAKGRRILPRHQAPNARWCPVPGRKAGRSGWGRARGGGANRRRPRSCGLQEALSFTRGSRHSLRTLLSEHLRHDDRGGTAGRRSRTDPALVSRGGAR
jgi:hypothetical protein